MLLNDRNQIAERWKNYCQQPLRNLDGKPNKLPIPGEKEWDILKDDVRKAIIKLRKNKATGADGNTAEMIELTMT